MDPPQLVELIDKATVYLRWSRRRMGSMNALVLGTDLRAHEDRFFGLLRDIQVACDALLEASRLVDGGAVRQQILTDQDRDPLLRYFRKACDARPQHLLRTALDSLDLEFQVVDPVRYRKARACYGITNQSCAMLSIAFGTGPGLHRLRRKLRDGREPDRLAIEAAGLKLTRSWQSVALQSFVYTGPDRKPVPVAAPKSHLGSPLQPTADAATEKVIRYYESHLQKFQLAM